MIEQNEMLATLKDVTDRLNDLGLAYMVTGSVAMGVYVLARTTYDVDIIVEISSADAKRFEQRFGDEYYVDATAIVQAGNDRSMFNIINNTTMIKVDCIVKKTDEFESGKFARRRMAELGGLEFWMIGKEDLILSKLKWAARSHSPRQFEDIGRLVESGVDSDVLSANIQKQGLDKVWKAFGEWKTRQAK